MRNLLTKEKLANKRKLDIDPKEEKQRLLHSSAAKNHGHPKTNEPA
jgi:hypothetical protein